MKSSRVVVAVLFVIASLSVPALAQDRLPFLGDEGLVTSTRTGNQTVPDGVDVQNFTANDPAGPAIDADDDGATVIVWSDENDGDEHGIFGRGFTPAGTQRFAEIAVNVGTAGIQENPHVAVDADGDFVVVWESDPTGTFQHDIFARGFNADGTQRFAEFQVNTITADRQEHPRLDMMDNGDFIIVWDSGLDDTIPGTKEVHFRRFAADGTPVDGADRVANVWMTGNQRFPDVAYDGAGGFVITWQSGGGGSGIFQDGSVSGIFARVYDETGTPQAVTNLAGQCFDDTTATQEICVNDYKQESQDLPRVARSDAGDFVITWHSDGSNGAPPPGESRTQDISYFSVHAKRFEANGDVKAPSWQVNDYTLSEQAFPDVTVAANGNFTLTWTTTFVDVSPPATQQLCTDLNFAAILAGDCDFLSEVYAEEYNADGTVKHAQFRLNTGTADINGTMTPLDGIQVYSAVDVSDTGDQFFAWSSGPPPAPFPGQTTDMQDGSGWGVLGRRGGHLGVAGEIFVDGFESGDTAAW